MARCKYKLYYRCDHTADDEDNRGWPSTDVRIFIQAPIFPSRSCSIFTPTKSRNTTLTIFARRNNNLIYKHLLHTSNDVSECVYARIEPTLKQPVWYMHRWCVPERLEPTTIIRYYVVLREPFARKYAFHDDPRKLT